MTYPLIPAGFKKQRGLATLLTSVVLLFLASVFMIVVSRSILLEQRMGANEIRSKEALEAAQAGIDQALVYISNPNGRGADQNLDNVGDDVAAVQLASGATYRYAFCVPHLLGQPAPNPQYSCPAQVGARPVCDYIDAVAGGATLPAPGVAAAYMGTPLIVSCGWSDDGLGRRMIMQGIGTTAGALTTSPTNPLIAKGALNVGGSANVVNYFNNLTVWTGGALSSVGNSGKTFVRNPNVAPPAAGTAPPGEPANCGTTAEYVCLTDKTTTGPDVIDNDPTLANLSDTQMFRNIFGTTLVGYAADAQVSKTSANVGDLSGVLGQTIYVNGNGGAVSLPNGTIGSRDRPVQLVIDGDLDLKGSPEIFGIVYVTGKVTGGGNVTVNGVLTVQGAVQPTGSVDIIYDPYITNGATERIGRPGLIPGSWRDWRLQ